MVVLKRIKILSLAKIAFFIYACIGFLVSFFIFSYYISEDIFWGQAGRSVVVFIIMNLLTAIVASLLVSLAVGAVGFVFGIMGAYLYNFFSARAGGFIFEIEEVNEKKKTEKKKEVFIKDIVIKKEKKKSN
ncbi:hypothetical protein GF382_01810 [Candidatus Falkowbacteria bacterium]|nr:hypothetical protein [Candidatus Falkowbacteria bacterium]